MRFHSALCLLALAAMPLTASAQAPLNAPQIASKTTKPNKAPAKKLPVWSPTAALSARLAPEKELMGWSIRPPRDYVFLQKADGANQVYLFQGDERPDGSSPIIRLVIGDILGKDARSHSEAQILESYLIQIHQHHDNWQSTKLETGLIRGRKFVRRRWTATTQRPDGSPATLHGVVYLTIEGLRFYSIAAQDTEPRMKTTLPLMEAAALTYHKR